MKFASTTGRHHTIDTSCSVQLSDLHRKKLRQLLPILVKALDKFYQGKIISSHFKKKPWSLSLLICGDAQMKKINFEYRSKNKTTDVLSFPAHQTLRKKEDVISGPSLFIGDIVISWKVCQKQAREQKIDPIEEFTQLFFHGYLHLLGFDHEISIKEEKLMQKWEKYLKVEWKRASSQKKRLS
jgi:probable rRNA maturation factor